jgi:hypothetical protein
MKKFFVSVGLIAVGTASLQAAYAPDWNSKSAAIWSISGTLRGFYDDNYQTAPSGPNKQGSFGFEFSPQFEFNVPLQQTELGMRYVYGLYYYQKREELGENPIDQTQQLDLWADHAFTERWRARVEDVFIMGQEPELIDPNTSVARRVNGNNIRNTGTLILNTVWTRLFSTAFTYQNSFFDYDNSGATVDNLATQGASLAGLLNRIEQLVSLDFQWHVAPETVAFFGGQFGVVNYTGNEPIAINTGTIGPPIYFSDARDDRSYYGYVGVQHNLLANLGLTGKIGAQYTDNYNDPNGSASLNPYADLSLIYTYLPGSYAQLGFTQTQNATDQVAPDSNGHITLNQESSTVYASINHKLTAKLLGTVIGRWQHSIYNGGFYNNQASDYYNLGVNLSYSFNQHLSADIGYNFDDLVSKVVGNSYTRNRIYLGVSAAY